jgi:hypothetical protein
LSGEVLPVEDSGERASMSNDSAMASAVGTVELL